MQNKKEREIQISGLARRSSLAFVDVFFYFFWSFCCDDPLRFFFFFFLLLLVLLLLSHLTVRAEGKTKGRKAGRGE